MALPESGPRQAGSSGRLLLPRGHPHMWCHNLESNTRTPFVSMSAACRRVAPHAHRLPMPVPVVSTMLAILTRVSAALRARARSLSSGFCSSGKTVHLVGAISGLKAKTPLFSSSCGLGRWGGGHRDHQRRGTEGCPCYARQEEGQRRHTSRV